MFKFEVIDKKPKKVKPLGKTPEQLVKGRLDEMGRHAPGGLLISDAGIEDMMVKARVETSRRKEVTPEDF